MIKLESAHIEEVRGIRKLDLDFRREKFAISGPNGSGKSGVIDAIEFGLTGQIGTLTGSGTKGLSVSEHGPHVDKTKFPDAALVELRVLLTGIGKSAKITRKVTSPKKPTIEPADDDVKAALAEIADHPEITLSRRDILRFILVEPTKRSEEIQTILKLDEIGQTRSALNTAQNKLQTAHRTATAQVKSARDTLQLHLQIPTLRAEDLLETVNKRRKVLNLPEIAGLTADTKLDAGLSDTAKTPEFNKESALRDLKALSGAAKEFPQLAKTEAAGIVADLAKLEDDPALLAAFQRRSFIDRRTRVSPLRQPVGGRVTPPRPPASEVGQVGGGPKGPGFHAEQRRGDHRGSHTSARPSDADPETRGRTWRGRVRTAFDRLEDRSGGTKGQACNRGRADRPEGSANSRLAGNTRGIPRESEGPHWQARSQA
jgi:AAA domain